MTSGNATKTIFEWATSKDLVIKASNCAECTYNCWLSKPPQLLAASRVVSDLVAGNGPPPLSLVSENLVTLMTISPSLLYSSPMAIRSPLPSMVLLALTFSYPRLCSSRSSFPTITHIYLSDLTVNIFNMQTVIHSAKNSFVLGPDGLPSTTLKQRAVDIPFILTKPFNLSPSQVEFREQVHMVHNFPNS